MSHSSARWALPHAQSRSAPMPTSARLYVHGARNLCPHRHLGQTQDQNAIPRHQLREGRQSSCWFLNQTVAQPPSLPLCTRHSRMLRARNTRAPQFRHRNSLSRALLAKQGRPQVVRQLHVLPPKECEANRGALVRHHPRTRASLNRSQGRLRSPYCGHVRSPSLALIQPLQAILSVYKMRLPQLGCLKWYHFQRKRTTIQPPAAHPRPAKTEEGLKAYAAVAVSPLR